MKCGSRSAACRRSSCTSATSLHAVELPLAEVVLDFFDRPQELQPRLRSFDYEFDPSRGAAGAPDILINETRWMPLDHHHRDSAYSAAASSSTRCRSDPRQMFEVAIQAAIARTDRPLHVKALRKNVIAKCTGGHQPQAQALRSKGGKSA